MIGGSYLKDAYLLMTERLSHSKESVSSNEGKPYLILREGGVCLKKDSLNESDVVPLSI